MFGIVRRRQFYFYIQISATIQIIKLQISSAVCKICFFLFQLNSAAERFIFDHDLLSQLRKVAFKYDLF